MVTIQIIDYEQQCSLGSFKISRVPIVGEGLEGFGEVKHVSHTLDPNRFDDDAKVYVKAR